MREAAQRRTNPTYFDSVARSENSAPRALLISCVSAKEHENVLCTRESRSRQEAVTMSSPSNTFAARRQFYPFLIFIAFVVRLLNFLLLSAGGSLLARSSLRRQCILCPSSLLPLLLRRRRRGGVGARAHKSMCTISHPRRAAESLLLRSHRRRRNGWKARTVLMATASAGRRGGE